MSDSTVTEPVEDEVTEEAPEAPEEADTVEDETTEDTFDKDRALAKIKKANQEAASLRKRATEAEAKAKENEGKSQRVSELEGELLRLRVGVKLGLPEALVSRLQGGTEEELAQDAQALLEMFSTKAPPTQQPKERLRGGGDPTSEPDGLDDPDKFAERMFRH